MISKSDQKKLETLFNAGAEKVESETEHWISGADESLSYCYDCAFKEVEQLLKKNPSGEYIVDGGWGIEGDSTPFCEICDKLLENTLTDYGCESEVDHFLDHGFDPKSDDDCRAMSEVISSKAWEPCENEDIEYFDNLYKLCERILEAILKSK